VSPRSGRAIGRVVAVAVAVALGLPACSTPPVSIDTATYPTGPRTPGPTDGGVEDASLADAATAEAGNGEASAPDAGSGGRVSTPSATCGFGPTSRVSGEYGFDDNSDPVWTLTAVARDRALALEMWAGAGGPVAPGAGVFTEDDEALESCGVCLVLGEGCSGAFNEYGVPACAKLFIPKRGGRWKVTDLGLAGGRFAGEIEAADLREVRVAVSSAGYFTTTVVPGGEERCLRQMSFEARLR
jgi:hypothetical protein